MGISLSSKIYYLFRLTQRLLDFIQENLNEDCTLTLSNLIAKVKDEFQVVVCCSKMHRATGRFRYSWKRTQNITIAADTQANEALRYMILVWPTIRS